MMTRLAISDQHWDRQGCERLLAQFESRNRRHDSQALQRRIEAAEKENNTELLCELLEQKQRAAKGLTHS